MTIKERLLAAVGARSATEERATGETEAATDGGTRGSAGTGGTDAQSGPGDADGPAAPEGQESGDEAELDRLRAELESVRAERDRERERADRLAVAVEETTAAAEAALDGDLTARVDVAGEGDAADLAAACNELLAEWSRSIERVREFSDQVEGATEQVAATTETVRERSRSVNESIREIADDADRQHERITTVTGEAEALSATVEEVASSADEVAAAAEGSAERATSGSEAATEALADLERIEQRTTATVESVESLVGAIDDIESIVDTIDDIADQTNMLALNASIEAARASEEGEGFAVVAEEVKGLAEQTQAALDEIESAIAAVRSEADTAAADMRETRVQVENGRETIRGALTALEDIAEDVDSVSGRVNEISRATESQAESTQQVAAMAEEVGEISETTAETAEEVAAAAREQTSILTEAQTATTTLSERTETLSASLERFETASATGTEADTTVEMWHAMSGEKGMLLEELAREFEAGYDGDVSVRLTAKGSYRGTLDATLNAVENGRPPTIAQLFEIGTKRAMDSGEFRPIEDVLPYEFDLEDLLDPVRSYYATDGRLYSLPFNASTPVFCYNRTAFERAGLDPANPPATFEGVREAAARVVERGAAPHGITFANYSWFVEQWFAEAGQPLVDRRNGRDGDATEAYFDSDAGREIFEWWTGLDADGLYHDPGIEARGAAKSAFFDGEAAMLIGSTSSLADIQAGAADAGFELGTAPIPVADEREGVVVGGASLWVPESVPRDQREAAGDFLAWLAQPEQQARWHRETGYFPIRHDAIDALRADGWFTENPHFETAIDQLLASSDTPATNGARIGPFDTVRTLVAESYLEARDHGVERALSDLDDQVERLLAQYRG